MPCFDTKMNRTLTTTLCCLTLLLPAIPAFAQQEGDGYENYYDVPNPDSTGEEVYSEEYYEGEEDPTKPKKKERKPYVRITMPYDTITELITYTDVVIQDESYIDSLYLRSKKYLMEKFKLSEKDFKESAKDMDKLIFTVSVPYYMQKNKYVKEEVGTLQFRLTLRFKDGKYKYVIDNLRHNMPANAAGARKAEYVYLEYYMRHDKNIIHNDLLLRAADAEINKIVKEIKKALREPVLVDEDEW